MRGLSTARFADAIAAIDAANAADPNVVMVRGEPLPLALAHGRLAMQWVRRLHPDVDDTMLLAARAHHLRRWELRRDAYPDGRAGYHRWKRDQRDRHAADIALLLGEFGYDASTVERVQSLVRRDDLRSDVGCQAVEDAACLAFIETQLAGIVDRLDHDHLIDVIRKTARKMSPAALAAVSEVPLGERERHLLGEALA